MANGSFSSQEPCWKGSVNFNILSHLLASMLLIYFAGRETPTDMKFECEGTNACKVCGFDGAECESCCLLGCDAVGSVGVYRHTRGTCCLNWQGGSMKS
jgi:hypothetical protein